MVIADYLIGNPQKEKTPPQVNGDGARKNKANGWV